MTTSPSRRTLIKLILITGISLGFYSVVSSNSLPAMYFLLLSEDAVPTVPGNLNDTGVTLCSDYAYDSGSGNHTNQLNCTLSQDGDSDPIPPGQDARSGRDVILNDSSDGHAGFNFTKLDASGAALANQADDYATTPWHCVYDAVTELTWEVKTDDSGLHDKDHTFTWYQPDNSLNGGDAGVQDDGSNCFGYNAGDSATFCNTFAYVNRVNTAGWCGANDWRLPTPAELHSLVSMDRHQPAIDLAYFPFTRTSGYRTSTPYANQAYIKSVSFFTGTIQGAGRINRDLVRLVRGG